MNKKLKHGCLVTLIFSVISLLYLYPIILVVINSFKKKAYISRVPFDLPKDNMFVGLENYIRGIEQTKFFEAFSWSLFITVGGVAVIILCCSMCAWFISRVNTWWTKLIYMLCLFAMVVPFQMGMIILVCWQQIGYMMIIYISGIQNIPGELIEAAKIDGANSWQVLRKVIIPMVMPSITICTFLTLTNGFKLFDQNLALTNGAPSKMSELLALNIFNTFYGRAGYEGVGQAKAVIFFLIVGLVAVIQNRMTRSKEVQQ